MLASTFAHAVILAAFGGSLRQIRPDQLDEQAADDERDCPDNEGGRTIESLWAEHGVIPATVGDWHGSLRYATSRDRPFHTPRRHLEAKSKNSARDLSTVEAK